MNDVATGIRESGKLNDKRGDKFANVLFFFISKVKVEVHDGGLSGIAYCCDVLYDCRTGSK